GVGAVTLSPMSLTTSVSGSPVKATTGTGAGPIIGSTDVSLLDVRPLFVVAVSCVLAMLVAHHYGGLNGPAYWEWPWRNLETLTIAPMLGALLPFVLAQWGFARGHWPRWSVLLLLMLTTFALETVAASARPSSSGHPVADAVWDPFITSYFTDAAAVS